MRKARTNNFFTIYQNTILSSFQGTEWNGERVSVEKSKAPGSSSSKGDRKQAKERRSFRDRKNSKTKNESSVKRKRSTKSTGKDSFKSRFSDSKRKRR